MVPGGSQVVQTLDEGCVTSVGTVQVPPGLDGPLRVRGCGASLQGRPYDETEVEHRGDAADREDSSPTL